jgi:hypothetical protein
MADPMGREAMLADLWLAGKIRHCLIMNIQKQENEGEQHDHFRYGH